jgi:predicted O-methyltransferase YrrM
MLNITHPQIENYLWEISSSSVSIKEAAIFDQMHKYAKRHDFPIIGPLVGRFLRQLAISMNARAIFEMGSGYGYSAMWFSGGLAESGKIICTDSNENNRKLAEQYFQNAGYVGALDFRIGDALEIAKSLAGPFDIILNDVDKEQYPESFDLAIPLLRKGGIFITDNVLWSGRIFNKKLDKPAESVLEFNRKLFNSPDILASILPIRDGLGIAVKIG